MSWRFDSRLDLNADLSPATGLIRGLGHGPSLSRNLEGHAMGLVALCLSFPICTKGSVGRKARVGASPFPTTSPDIHPGHRCACGVASAGSKDRLSPTSLSARRDRKRDPNEPFFHQTVQEGLVLSLCRAPRGAGSEGGSLRIPPLPVEPTPSPPSPALVASHRPGGPRPNPLERAGRSIAQRCHRTPPTPPVPAVCPPSRRAVPQSPSRNPTRIHGELGKSRRGRGSAFSPAQHGLS